ncbi:MAG: hypothetical protein SOZ52_08005 [Pyramidobacter sp.]|nr:hypothetical protein [Pyramidobacter sp.]
MSLRYIISCGVLLCAGVLLGIAQKFYREHRNTEALKFAFYGIVLITMTIVYFNMAK